jgi:hypothetical protein
VARAPRGGSWAAEYAARIARFERRHPGASRSAARGHSGGGEREADRLLRQLARLSPQRSEVHFAGTDRQPDGTWRRARFDILGSDGSEQTFVIPFDALGRLPEIRDAIAAAGFPTLGGNYLDSMVEWVEENEPQAEPVYGIVSPRSGRFVSGVSKKGNALTRADAGDAMTSETHDLERFLRRNRQLRKRGYRIVQLGATLL